MKGAGSDSQLLHRRAHQLFPGVVQPAVLFNLGRPHICVAGQVTSGKSFALPLTRRLYPRLDGGRGLPGSLVCQFVVLYSGDLNVDVDPVQQRAGNPFLIAGDGTHAARAIAGRVAIVTARAGISGSHQHKVRRESQRKSALRWPG